MLGSFSVALAVGRAASTQPQASAGPAPPLPPPAAEPQSRVQRRQTLSLLLLYGEHVHFCKVAAPAVG